MPPGDCGDTLGLGNRAESGLSCQREALGRSQLVSLSNGETTARAGDLPVADRLPYCPLCRGRGRAQGPGPEHQEIPPGGAMPQSPHVPVYL